MGHTWFGIGPILTGSNQRFKSRDKIFGAKLSWDSVGGECRIYWHVFPAGNEAEQLLKIGKPATVELVSVLEDENKGVAAHLILSQIWEPDKIAWEDRVEGNNFVLVYNGLKWTDVITEGSVKSQVDVSDLKKNADEWRRKLADLRARTFQ